MAISRAITCGLQVVDVVGLDHDADLSARLHREGLHDAGVGRADLLEALQALDVGLERSPAGRRASTADPVGDLGQHGIDRVLLHLAVVRLDAVHDLGSLAQPARDLGADDGVAALDLVRHRLADVVQERTALRHRGVQPDLGGQGAGDVGRFDQVPQDVLAVGRPVLQPSEQLDQLGVDVGDPDLGHGVLAGAPDLLLELAQGSLVDLLDPRGMDASVFDQLRQRHPRRLAADGVEAATAPLPRACRR